MLGASLYIIVCSAKNRIRMRIRRLCRFGEALTISAGCFETRSQSRFPVTTPRFKF